jgi:hypothetical protein
MKTHGCWYLGFWQECSSWVLPTFQACVKFQQFLVVGIPHENGSITWQKILIKYKKLKLNNPIINAIWAPDG